jgi:hypothetical protein
MKDLESVGIGCLLYRWHAYSKFYELDSIK